VLPAEGKDLIERRLMAAVASRLIRLGVGGYACSGLFCFFSLPFSFLSKKVSFFATRLL